MMGSMMRRAMLGDGSTLYVDFTSMTNGGQLANAGFTFTNATTTARTYINSSGLVATATTNEPRFDYDPTTQAPKGLLIEGTSTNLLQQSADWTVSPWSKPATITWDGSTYATAPDGTNTAKQITVTAGSSASIAQAVTTGTNRTISLWLRAGSLTSFSIGAFDSGGTTWGNNADSTCRIISGPGSAPVQQVGGLWSITGLSTTQWTRVEIFRSTTYTNLLAYPGSSSGTTTGTAFMWGMQMEAGNGASSLIPTVASQVTRNPDTAIIAAGSAFSSWYTGGTSGTFYADWHGGVRSTTGTNRSVFSTSDVVNRHFHMMQTAAAGNLRVSDFGGSTSVTTANAMTSGARTKGAFSFNGGNVKLCLNGGTVAGPVGVVFTTAPTWLVIGGTSTNGTSITDANVLLNGCVRQIKYWPTILTDAQLQSFTT